MSASSIDNFELVRTLGRGFSAKVKLAIDSTAEHETQVALKIFDMSIPGTQESKQFLLKQEVDALKKLDSKHVARMICYEEDTVMTKASGKTIPVAYIA